MIVTTCANFQPGVDTEVAPASEEILSDTLEPPEVLATDWWPGNQHSSSQVSHMCKCPTKIQKFSEGGDGQVQNQIQFLT